MEGAFLCFQCLGIPPKGELLRIHLLRLDDPTMFPISRDPPEGGTLTVDVLLNPFVTIGFQFLGIPPKGELQG